MGTSAAAGLPFKEAINFFRAKGEVRIPTARWNDLWRQQHARGFMIAGAARDAILVDFHQALTKALEKGTTLEAFRKDFDAIVARHGWSYNGSRGWRSEVIFSTNVRQATNAGRWQQLTDPDLLKVRPFLAYHHGDSTHPRELHLSWDGLVLPADHPWWKTHAPQNGWGCTCWVSSVGKRELAALGKTGPDQAPDDGTYEWTDKKTGAVHRVPAGIDPGFDYNVGEAAWGQTRQAALMEDQGPWRDLDPRGPKDYGRPGATPLDAARAPLGKPVRKGDEAALRGALREAIGGDEAAFVDPTGGPVLVTQALADHIVARPERWDGREAYFPLIRELIEEPWEIWVNFAVSEVSGRVAVRRKYVKAIRLGKKTTLGMYAETQDGMWVGGSFFRGKLTAIGNLRKGRLVYGRK